MGEHAELLPRDENVGVQVAQPFSLFVLSDHARAAVAFSIWVPAVEPVEDSPNYSAKKKAIFRQTHSEQILPRSVSFLSFLFLVQFIFFRGQPTVSIIFESSKKILLCGISLSKKERNF